MHFINILNYNLILILEILIKNISIFTISSNLFQQSTLIFGVFIILYYLVYLKIFQNTAVIFKLLKFKSYSILIYSWLGIKFSFYFIISPILYIFSEFKIIKWLECLFVGQDLINLPCDIIEKYIIKYKPSYHKSMFFGIPMDFTDTFDIIFKYSIWFREPATRNMIFIIDCFVDFYYFGFMISFVVFFFLFETIWLYKHRGFEHQIAKFARHTPLEIIWTVLPTYYIIMIAGPAYSLNYLLEGIWIPANFDESLTYLPWVTILFITGNQWYWTYEIPNETLAAQYPQQISRSIENLIAG